MLYSIEAESYIDSVPHRQQYDVWRSRLSDEEFHAVYDELSTRITGSEIETSSWIPGDDWTGTVFEPIYEKACRGDPEAAAKCFGLILWQVVMEHHEVWSFGRYEKDGVPISGLTYFRLYNPPPR